MEGNGAKVCACERERESRVVIMEARGVTNCVLLRLKKSP